MKTALQAATEAGLIEVGKEIERARRKFPGTRHLMNALTEEVGELARAYLDREGDSRIKAEAVQVACVAMRIYSEGDAEFAEDRLMDEVERAGPELFVALKRWVDSPLSLDNLRAARKLLERIEKEKEGKP